MTPEQQSIFIDEYKRKRKNAFLLFLLAIFFPIQHFLLGKAGIGVIFWLTCGGLGVWWIIEIFLAIPRTRAYNNDAAIAVMRDLKIMAA
jgi:TM2 domain-containing membrane protein YozV